MGQAHGHRLISVGVICCWSSDAQQPLSTGALNAQLDYIQELTMLNRVWVYGYTTGICRVTRVRPQTYNCGRFLLLELKCSTALFNRSLKYSTGLTTGAFPMLNWEWMGRSFPPLNYKCQQEPLLLNWTLSLTYSVTLMGRSLYCSTAGPKSCLDLGLIPAPRHTHVGGRGN